MKNLKTIIGIIVLTIALFSFQKSNDLKTKSTESISQHETTQVIATIHVTYSNRSYDVVTVVRDYYKSIYGDFSVIRCGVNSEIWTLDTPYIDIGNDLVDGEVPDIVSPTPPPYEIKYAKFIYNPNSSICN